MNVLVGPLIDFPINISSLKNSKETKFRVLEYLLFESPEKTTDIPLLAEGNNRNVGRWFT